jgi:hypothetical protein
MSDDHDGHAEGEEEVEGLMGSRIGIVVIMLICGMFVFIPYLKCCTKDKLKMKNPFSK